MNNVKQKGPYSREFKLEAVRLSFESGKITITQVANALGISTKRLYKWRDQVRRYGDNAFPGTGQIVDPVQKELGSLRKENQILREECAILKKSQLFLAKLKRSASNS